MNLTTPLMLTTTMLLGACTAEPPRGSELRDGPGLGDFPPLPCPISASLHPGVDALRCEEPIDDMEIEGSDPQYCVELGSRAHALIASHMRCAHDMQCEAVSSYALLGPTCLPAFACYLPVSSMADREGFVTAARDLDRTYAEACGCAVANCIQPDYMLALCEANACTLATDIPPQELPLQAEVGVPL